MLTARYNFIVSHTIWQTYYAARATIKHCEVDLSLANLADRYPDRLIVDELAIFVNELLAQNDDR